MKLTRREVLGLISAAGLRGAAFGLPVDTRPKYTFTVGQSLSNGGGGNPALSAHDASTTNRMLNGGNVWDELSVAPGSHIASLVDLAEGVGTIDLAGTPNTRESHCSGFANQISAWARANGMGAYHDTIQGSWGVGGKLYSQLKQGTIPYTNSISALQSVCGLAAGAYVPAVLCVHGESDGSCAYYPKVVEWQANYQTDIQAITHQSGNVPMFISQVQGQECNSTGSAGQPTYTGMLGAHELQYPLISLVCPKYMFPYIVGGTHLTNAGYRWLGEYYAKAYWRQVVMGQTWSPLRPSSVSTSSNVITIQFTGFVPPLVFDTVAVSQPADGNYGFVYDGGDRTITNVAITDPIAGTVQITLSGAPVSFGLVVMYGKGTGTPGGPTSGPRGCLRDSDPLVSMNGNTLYNWCSMFSKKLTYP